MSRKLIISFQTFACFLTLLCMTDRARAQLRVSGGTRLGLSGNVQLVLGGGNFVNNGTIGGTGGTLVFAGPVYFSGTGYTQVSNLLVSHPSAIKSVLTAPINITNTATLMSGNLATNDNLIIRSDISSTANLVVTGVPAAGDVQGLIARPSPAYGPCPSFPSVLSVNISGPQLRYQWESSPDSVNWTTITGATSHDYNAIINGTIYYRCHVTSGTTFDEWLPSGKMGLDTVASITGVSSIAVGSSSALTSATGGGSWLSSDPSVLRVDAATGVVTGVRAGAATITYSVMNVNACVRSASKLLQVTPGNKPVVLVNNPAPVCAPAVVDLTVAAVVAGSDAGLSYQYYTNAAGTTVLANPSQVSVGGTYYIVGTNTGGASSDLVPVTVTVVQAQNLKAAFSYNSYCINQPVQFTNTSIFTAPVTYNWSDNTGNSSTSVSPSFTYAAAGNVSVKLRVNSVTCPLVADSVTVVIPIEQPTPAIRMPKVTVGLNETMELRARSFGSSYTWTPTTGLSNPVVANPRVTLAAQEQEYRIAIRSQSGCVTVDTLLVQVFDKRIYVPNVFSPNGDGINDKLFVNIIGTNLRQLNRFRIYNRYSKLMFETTDASIGWDGKWNGVLQPVDTYVWVAEVKDSNGSVLTQSGNVTLLR